MKNPALLTNKLADKEEKAFNLFKKLSEISSIRKNTMDLKYKELRNFRCIILDKQEKDILQELTKLQLECDIIRKELRLIAQEEAANA